MKFGSQAIPPKVYTSVKLQVFTASEPNGLVWVLPFQVAVVEL